jgi:hypothetical protein
LVWWPTLLSVAVSALRLYLEVQGEVPPASGGAFNPIGITWLVFLFGAWFGWRLGRAGSRPMLRPGWVWSLLAFLALAGVVAWQISPLDRTDRSDVAYQLLREAVQGIVVVAIPIAGATFAVWPRLAATLLAYAIPARLTVVALTWLAKHNGWDTHYTKFGPAGIERRVEETAYAASVAQLGFWVPFTVIAGSLAGCLAARVARPPASA